MFLLALTPGISMTEDLGRHWLLGRIIVESGSVPDTNLLTFSCPDFPFVNHHWLSQVLFYGLHQAVKLNGLIVLKALMMAGVLGLALFTVGMDRRSGLYLSAGALCAIALAYRAHIRPELFTYFGVALYGRLLPRIDAARGRKYAAWWAVLLLYGWCWANAHIYFIFGVGMVGAYVLALWMVRVRECRTLWRSFPLVPAVMLAGLCVVSSINPNGWFGFFYPLTIFSNYGIQITENASPLELWKTVLNPALLALPMLSVICLYALVKMGRHAREASAPQLARMIIASVALVASWCMARSIPLLAITLPPLLADAASLRPVKPQGGKTAYAQWIGVGVAVAVNLVLIGAVLSGRYYRIWPSPIGPTPFGLDDEQRYLALRDLQAKGLSGPVFNDYNIGSLVEYNLYPEPAYVDNRPEAFPAVFWQQEYLPAIRDLSAWENLLQQRSIQTIAVSLTGMKAPFVRLMMRAPEWQLVHIDFLIAVWVRKSEPNQAILEQATYTYDQLDAYIADIAHRLSRLDELPLWRRQVAADQVVYELYSLICLDRQADAWPLLLQLHMLYPDYQVVHELMMACAPPSAYPALDELMRKQARWPRSAKQVLDHVQREKQNGNEEQARRAVRRGLFFFPLNERLRQFAGTL
jgi:hypothetical protein